jgi:SAM-dependent methyltransferase
MSIKGLDYVRYTYQMFSGYRSNGEREVADRRSTDLASVVSGDQPLRILDLANGRLRPQYTILKAAGAKVVGIDLVNHPSRNATDLAYVLARRLYVRKLGISSDVLQPQSLVCGDTAILPFYSEIFDVVTSVAAFEHFLNVPAVVAELHRVLRPGGVAWIGVHLFTCLSGAHNFRLTEVPLRKVPKGIDPWDHLRKRRLPFHVPLNEWRKDQYLEQFAQRFEILKAYTASREGVELLTPDIERELADYSRDELTCRSFVIVARKS